MHSFPRTLAACLALFSFLAGAPVATQSLVAWQRAPVLHGRITPVMAYDAARAETVLFGGYDVVGELSDTWIWDGFAWQRRNPTIAPLGRRESAMAFDATRRETVLFSGMGNAGPLADTWVWDGSSWTARTPANAPSARRGHAMAYDAARQRLVLYGGYDGVQQLSDTWEWDGTNWSQRVPAATPGGRAYHAMAYDASSGGVLLFGGWSPTVLGDTWFWNGVSWTLRSPPQSPAPRHFHAMCADTLRGVVVLHGGQGSANFGDTWQWNGASWVALTPALFPRWGSAMAFHAATGHSLLFGGRILQAGAQWAADETWAWNGLLWTQPVPGASPDLRYSTTLTYDSQRNRAVLFGGERPGQPLTYIDDTWEWNGTQWVRIPTGTSPSPRGFAAAAQHPGGGVLLFGGRDSITSVLGDTWTWDGMVWTPQSSANAPAARALSAAVFDAARNEVVLFGGWTSSGGPSGTSFGDTYVWRGAQSGWSRLAPVTSPPKRYAHALTYDEARGVVVLFGGYDTGVLADTWEWDGTNWLPRTPANGPPARSHHAIAYDPVRRCSVMSHGHCGPGCLRNDLWEWDGTTWTLRQTTSGPHARYSHAMFYDSPRSRVVLFGGNDTSWVLSDTWDYFALYPGHFFAFGSGCAGSTPKTPVLTAGLPWTGLPFTGVLSNLPVGTSHVPFVVFGPQLVPPLDLSNFGAPLCTLEVNPTVPTTWANQGGTAPWSIPIPNNLALLGASFDLQGAVLDASANSLGIKLSNAGHAIIGAK